MKIAMNYLTRWIEYIRSKDRYFLLGLVALVVIALAYLLFVPFFVGRCRHRIQLASQVVAAQKALATAKKAEEKSPEVLEKQIATAQATLDAVASVFLTDSQAAEVLIKLYEYANETQVEIVGLQTQPAPEKVQETPEKGEEKRACEVRALQLEARGALPDLMAFVSRVEMSAIETLMVTNVSIIESDKLYTLSMDITLYTSPFASGAVVQPTSSATLTATPMTKESTPSPTATPVCTTTPTLTLEERLQQMAQSLHELWAAENWEAVIGVIEQIRALDPDYDDITEKLYAACVNYGYKLLDEGRLEGAKEQFSQALAVKPDGGEAMEGLRLLAGETTVPTAAPQPSFILYVVGRGDTLYSIARRYGTTVQAIMTTNGLTSYSIYVGQRLYIPLR